MQKLLEGLGWVEGEPRKRVWRRHDDQPPPSEATTEATGQEGYGPAGLRVLGVQLLIWASEERQSINVPC